MPAIPIKGFQRTDPKRVGAKELCRCASVFAPHGVESQGGKSKTAVAFAAAVSMS